MKPKTRKKMRLIDAAYKDCAQMMRQDESYRAYIVNISKEIGKGLNIRQIQECDRRAREERAKRYADALMHGDVNAKTDEEDPAGKENVFIPTDAARHRAPKVHSKKNPTQRKPKGRMYTNSQEDGNMADASQPFQHDKMVVPRNLVFSRKTKRFRPDGAGGQVRNKVATNAFFCARDMASLSMEFPKICKKMIYMGNLTFNQLTPAHKKYLKSKGYWDAIIANRRLKAAYQ